MIKIPYKVGVSNLITHYWMRLSTIESLQFKNNCWFLEICQTSKGPYIYFIYSNEDLYVNK